MGWRFRTSIKLAPGLRLNLGKTGVTSLSIGGKGARLNLGKRGTRATVGLPGTGVSYSTQLGKAAAPSLAPASGAGGCGSVVAACVLLALVYACATSGSDKPAGSNATREPPAAPLAAPALPPAMRGAPPARAEPAPGPTRPLVTISQGANVRAGPAGSSAVLRTVPQGMQLQLLGVEGNWLHLAGPDGVAIGWVHRSLVAP